MSRSYDHGGNIFTVARTLGVPPDQILDFSASINPLGMSSMARSALISSIDNYLTGQTPSIDTQALVSDIVAQTTAMQQIMALQGSTVIAAVNSSGTPVYLVSQVINESNNGLTTGSLALDSKGVQVADTNAQDVATHLHAITLTDLASEISQLSLAEFAALDVQNVTVLGSNTSVQINLTGNGQTSMNWGVLNPGLFSGGHSVTLEVNSQAQFADVINHITQVEDAGINGFGSTAGTLSINAATAESWIANGIKFSSGSFVATPTLINGVATPIGFEEANTLVSAGVGLAPGTVVDATGQTLSVAQALNMIQGGISFTSSNPATTPPTVSVSLGSSDLLGNAATVGESVDAGHANAVYAVVFSLIVNEYVA